MTDWYFRSADYVKNQQLKTEPKNRIKSNEQWELKSNRL